MKNNQIYNLVKIEISSEKKNNNNSEIRQQNARNFVVVKLTSDRWPTKNIVINILLGRRRCRHMHATPACLDGYIHTEWPHGIKSEEMEEAYTHNQWTFAHKLLQLHWIIGDEAVWFVHNIFASFHFSSFLLRNIILKTNEIETVWPHTKRFNEKFLFARQALLITRVRDL